MSPKDSDDEYSDLGYYPSDSIAKKKSKTYLEITALVLVWYCGAVATITTSKVVLNTVKLPFLLCSVQFFFATVLTYTYLLLTDNVMNVPSTLYTTVFQISSSYTFGFILTNSAFSIGKSSLYRFRSFFMLTFFLFHSDGSVCRNSQSN